MTVPGLDDPALFAALVAPVVDRAAVGVHMAVPRERVAEFRTKYGIERLGYLIELRQPVLAGVPVSLDGLAAIVRYPPPGFIDDEIARQLEAGTLVRDGDQLIGTERGRAVVTDVISLQDEVVTELWAWRAPSFERLYALVVKAIEAGRSSGGAAFAIQTSAPVPSGWSAAFRLWSVLWPLRYHRADAHAAAWEAEGLSAHEMTALGPGEQRGRIEAETNRRAAPPWEGLTPAERLELLAGIGALPGSGQPTTVWTATPRR